MPVKKKGEKWLPPSGWGIFKLEGVTVQWQGGGEKEWAIIN